MNRISPSVIPVAGLSTGDTRRAGGKAVALARLAAAGLPVPPALCVTTDAYHRYLDLTGIRQRLPLLLERKPFADMRWEELWDLGLVIRNLFLSTPLPPPLQDELSASLSPLLGGRPLTVRSSAPVEDSSSASFAGLHDSFVNVRGTGPVLDSIRLVWSSLWSDRALLYRQELGLDPATSSMAVIVQEMIDGDRSGVAFGSCPGRPGMIALEAVWGLNQGLVDGDVEPDRLILDPLDGTVVERYTPRRLHACRAAPPGVTLRPLPPELRDTSPLAPPLTEEIVRLLRRAEEIFGAPQDMEWTASGERLFILQSRPITTGKDPGTDGGRGWYLSLHKSLATLMKLRSQIEGEILPLMERDADTRAAVDPARLSDRELAAEIDRRRRLLDAWEERYREVCIPMAHGIRLFGELYNDRLRPSDPFAFLTLLRGDSGLLARERNRDMERLADIIRRDPELANSLRRGERTDPESPFGRELARFVDRFGDISWVLGEAGKGGGGLTAILLEMARNPPPRQPDRTGGGEREYFAAFTPEEREFARQVLETGRAAYRLRDNDNLSIGRLTARLREAEAEAVRRGMIAEGGPGGGTGGAFDGRVTRRLSPPSTLDPTGIVPGAAMRARQIVGQPAGPGLGRGSARVVRNPSDLGSFRGGEILVCDAVDPNMTFVVPLAAGIVERRGGMLIHGAIIAREYGLPCVTGVPGATELIDTGDLVTVDGHLGIVTVEKGGTGRWGIAPGRHHEEQEAES